MIFFDKEYSKLKKDYKEKFKKKLEFEKNKKKLLNKNMDFVFLEELIKEANRTDLFVEVILADSTTIRIKSNENKQVLDPYTI